MEAEDTVMSPEALKAIVPENIPSIGMWRWAPLERSIAKAQAEITWPIAKQSGMQEVVDWIKEHNAQPDEILDTWKAQLKEWDIKLSRGTSSASTSPSAHNKEVPTSVKK